MGYDSCLLQCSERAAQYNGTFYCSLRTHTVLEDFTCASMGHPSIWNVPKASYVPEQINLKFAPIPALMLHLMFLNDIFSDDAL
jgi:hypothetical protein